LNAPRAVVASAVIYVLRTLINEDIPLNGGFLKPVRLAIPHPSLLSPTPGAAVVGGNVETSSRITDVLLQAFGAVAGAQGTMNNLTFGDEAFGYYETIGGGTGAGPDWDGKSGLHAHMSNTRITDAEILERRRRHPLGAPGVSALWAGRRSARPARTQPGHPQGRARDRIGREERGAR
jgi:5-oxoprolinase (ATP-hydrolysing)